MKNFLAVIFSFFTLCVFAGQDNRCQFSVDLTSIKNDRAEIILTTPKFESGKAVYRFPAMVPGTYAVYNFGRFVSGFRAYDKDLSAISFTHPDVNTWVIDDASKLYRIAYFVEDTWDTSLDSNWIFEPAGTNFETDSNYVINTHGMFGYFEGKTRIPYEVTITHKEELFGATGLSTVTRTATADIFSTPSYNELVDGPIMYCRPDTAHLMVGGADILISVYSPRSMVKSKFIAETILPLLDAQRQYLGGTLPVKNYAFLIYLSGKGFRSGAFGALEHSYSSMYCLMEMKQDMIAQTIRDVAAHEFFHILTPLNIHSFEIGDFDYNKPKMSQHLWMYEGLTEYAASHVQVKYGTMTLEEYLEVLNSKMYGADDYKDSLPFTVMSKGALDVHKEQYNNVYEKGALIGLCLDIRLRQLSGGKYGTQELMRDLSKTYGKEKSFNDDELFATIEKLTYPEIGQFFRDYVAGKKPLPIKEMMNAVGITYRDSIVTRGLTLGGFSVGINGKKQLVAVGTESMNSFGRKMGFEEGDILLSLNGKSLEPDKARDIIGGFMSTAKAGTKLVIVVGREQKDGSIKTKKLKGRMHYVTEIDRHVFSSENANAGPGEQALRKAWIGK